MHLLQGYEMHAEKEQKQKYLKGKKQKNVEQGQKHKRKRAPCLSRFMQT